MNKKPKRPYIVPAVVASVEDKRSRRGGWCRVSRVYASPDVVQKMAEASTTHHPHLSKDGTRFMGLHIFIVANATEHLEVL